MTALAAPHTAFSPVDHLIPGLGKVRGRQYDHVTIFRGVPYAEPPIGDRRFSPPIAIKPWEGTLDAERDGPIAPQVASRVFEALGPGGGEPGDEDCLSLTIWAPNEAKAAPVLIWFHGGGFSTGAGSSPWYDGSLYAERHGVVVVNMNYRLGALGYLSLPGIFDGNLAILDMFMALRWVKDHVEAFGGDPDNITVAGESGGAHTILSFLNMQATEGLFHRAILQSPPFAVGLATPEESTRRAHVFLDEAGVDIEGDILAQLRALDVSDILKAQLSSMIKLANLAAGDFRPPFVPNILAPHNDACEDFGPAAALAAAKRGVDIMVGWTRDEANLFSFGNPALETVSDDMLHHVARAKWGDKAEEVLAAARVRRPDGDSRQLFLDLLTDDLMRLPALQFARTVSDSGGNAFVYQFDWASAEPDLGACHCIDLPPTFGCWEAWHQSPMMEGTSREEFDTITDATMSRWAGFIKDGDPGFPKWSRDRSPILHLDLEPHLET